MIVGEGGGPFEEIRKRLFEAYFEEPRISVSRDDFTIDSLERIFLGSSFVKLIIRL